MIQLTEKETLLLKDLKSHEEQCIEKYNNYAGKASDPQLKQLFNFHAQQEQQHLNTINTILSGQLPNMNSNASGNNQKPTNFSNSNANSPEDAYLCKDLLMTEKYVSGAYDTSIFEFTNSNIRQSLNHIQKEEQQHGEDIFKYMESKGMYNPQ
ncbi:DUF892 family protein [Clostridium rectalis]|uniref:DUF892 family protein n=1 Tax=Clostridium rectalis TaxID=2040295 RepID=UPI000F632CAF|nr:DUF892 family protein [Clostridium rectalis]